ncbi:hypothetical protein TVAG_304290 [Trichomonas vaginalis G3]|uniref:Uncharacterized protein n=1 Tax=Trichomonas vaginalis (strain ATCC PRA-98 / G3) TaxID=412133 RepID=A2FGR3_TRIV3|nr:chromatin disassembly [Trichomonas vaginalis G3]EAX95899.1 hypothetical protein TVAG_304290 [Trichomonas vaginalis G3]KAI5551223.1 chromatin disassembly [Trichomonas vaginalis G3]|eukprot:XP_001308829.1 hypothetical protein [Trichomonas vaginalis G3]
MEPLPVLLPDEIVPFFINIVFDDQRLFEIIQVKLNEADPEEMTKTLTYDLKIQPIEASILSAIESQLEEYKKLTEMVPSTEWAKNGSAVHVLLIEASTESVVYSDQFEWDIFDRTMNPDEFSRLTLEELALPAEFINTVSAQIRHQVIRLRCMHCFPDKFAEYIKLNPISSPQTITGFRPVSDLIDVSPVVGLRPGRESKSTSGTRDRDYRHQRRANNRASLSFNTALHRADDVAVIQVKLVPTVRAVPMPEDNPNINLAAIPSMLNDPEVMADDTRKVTQKLEQARYCPAPTQFSGDESDNESENDMY